MKKKRRISDLILVLMLFGVFASGAVMLAAFGSNTYRTVTQTMQADYNHRTGVLYLAEKTRQNDVGGGVRIDTYNGNDALVLTERVTGRAFETWIFVNDGQLCEEFISSGAKVDPALVQKIMPMTSMELEWSERDLLQIALVTADGKHSDLSLNIQSNYLPYQGRGGV